MRVNLRTGLIIGLTVAVVVVAALMFSQAGTPMSDEGEAASAWASALCARRLDDLYALSALPDGTDREAFVNNVTTYLNSGAIPVPCHAEINYNLIRTLVVPESLKGQLDRVRYFAEVTFDGTEVDGNSTIPLWLYHASDGHWRVWASFFGATLEQPVSAGEPASLLDLNGAIIGTVRVLPPILTYAAGNQTFIGVPIQMQTLSQPWEHFEAQLYVNQERAPGVEYADQLPDEVRGDFRNPRGDYVPQNLEQAGTFWFRAEATTAPILLAFNAGIPYSGTLQSVYLNIPADSVTVVTPFNPFTSVRLVGIANDNPTYEFGVDTSGLPMDYFHVDCGRFVLVMADDSWNRGTDCAFVQGGWQDFLPNERASLRVTFAGYNIASADAIQAILYRRGEESQLVSYTLWQNESGS